MLHVHFQMCNACSCKLNILCEHMLLLHISMAPCQYSYMYMYMYVFVNIYIVRVYIFLAPKCPRAAWKCKVGSITFSYLGKEGKLSEL